MISKLTTDIKNVVDRLDHSATPHRTLPFQDHPIICSIPDPALVFPTRSNSLARDRDELVKQVAMAIANNIHTELIDAKRTQTPISKEDEYSDQVRKLNQRYPDLFVHVSISIVTLRNLTNFLIHRQLTLNRTIVVYYLLFNVYQYSPLTVYLKNYLIYTQ